MEPEFCLFVCFALFFFSWWGRMRKSRTGSLSSINYVSTSLTTPNLVLSSTHWLRAHSTSPQPNSRLGLKWDLNVHQTWNSRLAESLSDPGPQIESGQRVGLMKQYADYFKYHNCLNSLNKQLLRGCKKEAGAEFSPRCYSDRDLLEIKD